MIRYRSPTDPYLIMLCAYAVVCWLDARREVRRKTDEVSSTPISAA